MKLIDANTNVQDYVETWMCNCSDYGRQHVMAVDDVCTLPVIDPVHAANACYCKECWYYTEYGECKEFSDIMKPDEFCSRGVIKSDKTY